MEGGEISFSASSYRNKPKTAAYLGYGAVRDYR